MASLPEGRLLKAGLPKGRFADGKLTEARRFNKIWNRQHVCQHTDLDHRARRTPEAAFRGRPLLPRDRSPYRRQPQRRDRQAYPPRSDARPGQRRAARDSRKAPRRQIDPRQQYQMLQVRLRRTANRSATRRSQASSPARCSNSASSDAAGRSPRPAPRIFAFAATCRSTALPYCAGHTRLAYRSGSRARVARARSPPLQPIRQPTSFGEVLIELRRIGLLRRLPHALVELVGVVADQDAPALGLDAVEDDLAARPPWSAPLRGTRGRDRARSSGCPRPTSARCRCPCPSAAGASPDSFGVSARIRAASGSCASWTRSRCRYGRASRPSI